jgi:transposase
MNIVGLDLGKRKSQICIQDKDGKVLEERRIHTTRDAIASYFTGKSGRVLLEASTSSEWVARCLEELGLEVVVGDPRFGPMYAQQDRRIKTDRRDAKGLADALRMGAFRAAHRRSDTSVQIRRAVLARNSLVQARTKLVNQTRSLCEREGFPGIGARSNPDGFLDALSEQMLDEKLAMDILPLASEVHALNETIDELTTEMEELVKVDGVATRLDKVVGIGVVTALAFKAAVDDPSRFPSSKALVSYLGLVPSERSSGDARRQGRITKAGDTLTRALLVQAAWCVMRSKSKDYAGLRAWAEGIAARRGKQRAAVALARKLARVMFAMWRDGADFDPLRATRV